MLWIACLKSNLELVCVRLGERLIDSSVFYILIKLTYIYIYIYIHIYDPCSQSHDSSIKSYTSLFN